MLDSSSQPSEAVVEKSQLATHYFLFFIIPAESQPMFISFMLFIIFFSIVAMLWNEGCWSNLVTLVNVLLAALIATNYFEPAAAWVEKAGGKTTESYTYFWDFLMLWTLFFIAFSILRGVTGQLSKTRVRFKMPVEHVGRVFFGMWTAWILVCFTAMSLHLAPLGPNPFRGTFATTPTSSSFFGLSPDRQWLAYMQGRSRGSLSRSGGEFASDNEKDKERRVFDPHSEFLFLYHSRRANLEKHNEATSTVRVNAD